MIEKRDRPALRRRPGRQKHTGGIARELQGYEREHLERVRRLGAECAVLLKTSGAFPLDGPGPVALFGSGARRTVKGGTGSGEVNSRVSVSIEKGLERAGFTVSTKYWLDTYDAIYSAERRAFLDDLRARVLRGGIRGAELMGAIMPEPDYRIPLYGEGDCAVYVLSRNSGEGTDRRAIPGDILLTETEIRDILTLKEKYPRFLLVLNVGGVVDLSPVTAVEDILLLSQLGAETGDILADLLLGRSCPSGRLATTWAAWEDYPKIGEFGARDDTRYKEGVYLGYRYFDSVEKEPLFPFGYGLGYSSFTLKAGALRAAGETIELTARASNTGARPGKTVAQIYATAPGKTVDQPWQSLVAFAKTPELQPGETAELTLRFELRDLAYYDEEAHAWTLEKGSYLLRLGQSSRDTKLVGAVKLDKEVQTLRCRACCGEPDFTDWAPARREREEPRFLRTLHFSAKKIRTEKVRYQLDEPVDPEIEALSETQLMLLGIGAFNRKGGSTSAIGEASRSVAGAAGETLALSDRGIPKLVMADGPAGLRLSREYVAGEKGVYPVGDTMPESVLELIPRPVAWMLQKLAPKPPKGEIRTQYATAIPIGTAVAQSWNVALAEELGDIVGAEMERFGVHLWLAPALDLHRDIRCGRDFEYFSEDPLISGKFAAALTRGVQKHPGCGTTVKHFAANDQETDRYNSNSQVSERALRELHLRGFGIAVRESQPLALMTSYNLINGVHTAQRRDLIQDILRAEFGFRGIVMTDWIMAALQAGKHRYPGPDAGRIAAAGGDLTMPGCKGDLKAMQKARRKHKLSRRQLQINATRIMQMARMLHAQRKR